MQAIRTRDPHSECFGLGGERMEKLGFRRIVRSEDMAHMGITEVVRHMPRIYAGFRRLKASLKQDRPDVAVLIDFPDVNLRLAKALHALGIPTIYFVSPQVWAWKKRRIRWIKLYVTRMLVIFPFEVPFYSRHGVAADFVGHPLADLPLPGSTTTEYAAEHSLDPGAEWIGLLPGSRRRQVTLNLPEMLRAARLLASRPGGSRYQFLVPVAPGLTRSFFESIIQEQADGLSVHLTSDARATLFHARASIVSSGTATIDAALTGNPFVVVYRLSAISYAIARRVVDVPHVAMVNLIAGERMVPELIQKDFTAEEIVSHLLPLLTDGDARSTMQTGLRAVRAALEAPASSTVTDASAIEAVAAIALSYTQIKPSNRPVPVG